MVLRVNLPCSERNMMINFVSEMLLNSFVIAVNHDIPLIISISAKLNLEKLLNVKLITHNDGFSFMGLIMGL